MYLKNVFNEDKRNGFGKPNLKTLRERNYQIKDILKSEGK